MKQRYKKFFENEIPNGANKKVIIKVVQYYSPQIIAKGNGTKLLNKFLSSYGFKFNSKFHIWKFNGYSDKLIKEISNILKQNNYQIELEGETINFDNFIKKVRLLNNKEIYFYLYELSGTFLKNILKNRSSYCIFDVNKNNFYFKKVDYKEFNKNISIDIINFDQVLDLKYFNRKGKQFFNIEFEIDSLKYRIEFGIK